MQNKQGEINANLNLNIQDQEEEEKEEKEEASSALPKKKSTSEAAPEIPQDPVVKKEKKSSVIIEASVASATADELQVQWLKEGKALETKDTNEASKFSVTKKASTTGKSNETIVQLEIEGVAAKDAGEYQLVAKSEKTGKQTTRKVNGEIIYIKIGGINKDVFVSLSYTFKVY